MKCVSLFCISKTCYSETYMVAEVSKCELTNLREDVERLTRELELSKEGEIEWKSRAELAESRMENLEKDVKQLSESSKALRDEHADAMKVWISKKKKLLMMSGKQFSKFAFKIIDLFLFLLFL